MKRSLSIAAAVLSLSFLPSAVWAHSGHKANCLCTAGEPCECGPGCDCHLSASSTDSTSRQAKRCAHAKCRHVRRALWRAYRGEFRSLRGDFPCRCRR